MEIQSGKDWHIVSQPTDGKLTLEMDITEACKSVSLPGTNTEMISSRIIHTVQNGEIRLKLLVEFKQDRVGTLGQPVENMPKSSMCKNEWHLLGTFQTRHCPECGARKYSSL